MVDTGDGLLHRGVGGWHVHEDDVPAGRLKIDGGGGDRKTGDEDLGGVPAVVEPITRRPLLGGGMGAADRQAVVPVVDRKAFGMKNG